MPGNDLFLHVRQKIPHQNGGDIAVGRACLSGICAGGQDTHTQAEALFTRPDPHKIQYILIIACPRQHMCQPLFHLGRIRQTLKEVRRKHSIKDGGILTQVGGQPGGRTANSRNQIKQAGVCIKQREELHPGGKSVHKLVEPQEGDIGICGAGECAQQCRHQRSQTFARSGTSGCGHSAGVPSADRACDFTRVLKAQAAQSRRCFRVILRSGKDETASLFSQWRGAFEQGGIMGLYPGEVFQQICFKTRAPVIPHENSDMLKPFIRSGKRMCLFVINHLYAVFERAQKSVGRLQVPSHISLNPFFLCQSVQHGACLHAPKFGVTTAGDQLLGLDEEFDLANTAPAQLDIVTGHCNTAMPPHCVDLPLHRVDILDRGIVQIFAPDERCEGFQKSGPGFHVPRRQARLDEGRSLPVLPPAFVILLCRRQ